MLDVPNLEVPMLEVAVLVGPELSLMGTAGALEMLDECAELEPGPPRLRLHQVGRTAGGVPGRFGTAFQAGLGIDSPAPRLDLVILPPVKQPLGAHADQLADFVPWLRERHAEGALLCSLCTGSFLLAETGLLDGGRAATHWAFQGLFAERYPAVEIVEHAMLVEGAGVVMTGGALAFTNGLLFVVERLLGAETSIALSKLFVVDRFREHQGAFTIFAGSRAHGDETVARCQSLIERDHTHLDLAALSEQVGLSPRSVRRRFKQALGLSPQDYLRRARVEAARRQLERTERSVWEVMESVGYSDRKTFARTFREVTGLSPADYRRRHRFRSVAARG
jgi:transcriptional regulator GlxA family with amidase domain